MFTFVSESVCLSASRISQQEAQLMLTNHATRLEVSQGHQT